MAAGKNLKKYLINMKILITIMYIGWIIIIAMILPCLIKNDTENLVFLFTRTGFPWILTGVIVYTTILMVGNKRQEKKK